MNSVNYNSLTNLFYSIYSKSFVVKSYTIKGLNIQIESNVNEVFSILKGLKESHSFIGPRLSLFKISKKKYLKISNQFKKCFDKKQIYFQKTYEIVVTKELIVHFNFDGYILVYDKINKNILFLSKNKFEILNYLKNGIASTLEHKFYMKGYIPIHGASLVYKNKAMLLFGDRLKGKSTFSYLFSIILNTTILSDDFSFINITDNNLKIF